MNFPFAFYLVSYKLPLADSEPVTEYFYFQTEVSLSHQLQTTQNPERYGGTIFLNVSALAIVLKLIRNDARYASYKDHIVVQRAHTSDEPLTSKEIDEILKSELLKNLDREDRRVLGISQ
jgi:hypothetical protein